MNEQQMVALVERVGEVLEPDVARLVAGGVALGRVRRTRRRVATAVGAAAAVVAIAVAAPLLGSGGTDAGPAPATTPEGMPQLAVPARAMGTTLAGLLPGARVVADDEPYQLGIQRGTVRWHGVDVSVMIDTRALGIDSPTWQRCSTYMGGGKVCDPAPDGGRLVRGGRIDFDLRTGAEQPRGAYDRLYVSSGYVLEVSATLDGDVDRALLRRIATDDVWWR